MPYSTPPQEKRDEDGARHESDTTGEEEECTTPQTRKHKLLKYVQQPSASKDSNPGKSDTGQFSIAERVDKYQGTSERRDPPPSSLYGEAINLKVESKKDTPPVKSEPSPVKKESSPVKKESSPVKVETPSPVKKDERVLRGQKTRSVKPQPEEVSDEEEEEEEEGVFPRLVEVWSEKEREDEAAASAEKSIVQKSEVIKNDVEHLCVDAKEDGLKPHVIDVSCAEECKKETPTDATPCETDPLEDTTTVTTAQTISVKDETKPVKNESEAETPSPEVAVSEKSEDGIVDSKADDAVEMKEDAETDEADKVPDQMVVENKAEEVKTEELATTIEVPESEPVVELALAAIMVESVPDIVEPTPVPDVVETACTPNTVEMADEIVLPAKIDEPIVDLVSVEKTSIAPETPVEDISSTEVEPEVKATPITEPVEKDESEVKEVDEVIKSSEPEKDSIDSPPDKVNMVILRLFSS